MAILVPQQEDVAREAFLVDPTKADDGKARAAARVLAKEALKAQTIAEMPEGTFKTEEEKAGAASRIVELMTGEKDYDGRLWNGGKGFKTGAEYLRSVQEAVRRGTQAAMDPDLQAWLRMTDEQKDAKVEAERGFPSKFGESVGDVGDALGEVVRGVPQLSKEEYESAPAEVREASDAMGSVMFGDMPEKERGEYEAKVREWRGSDWQKLKRRSEYEAKLRRKNALVYLPDMIRTLETDDAKELAGELAQNPEKIPANWTARLKQLPTRDIETLAQIRGMTREHVEGGFFNTLGDMGIAAYNAGRNLLAGIGAQEAKLFVIGNNSTSDMFYGGEWNIDFNETIRRKHALWNAYAGWSAPIESISDEHGAIANFTIGLASAVPFVLSLALKALGFTACATEMMSEADAKAAAEGIDVTNPAYCAQSALMGGLYAYMLKAVSPKFFGATANGAAEEMALRTAFLKGVLSGCAKLDTAKVMSQRTASGAFMMAMQQGIAAINEDLNLGGDAWRDASQRFAETFVSSIPDMLAFSAHGVLKGHARNSGGWRRMFGAEGRANRSQNLRDAVETAFAVKTAVNGQRGIEDRRRATLIAQIAEMGRAWTEGGEKALAKLGLKPEEIAEAKDYFEAERRRFGAAERLSELNDAGGVEWSPGEEPVDIETAAERLEKAFAEARTAQGVLAERLLGKMKDESGAVRDLASVRNIWAEGHAVGAGRKDGDGNPDIDHDAGAAALVKAGFAPKDASELSRAFGAERRRMYSPDAAEALRALYTRSTRGQVEATAALASAFGGKMRTVGWRTYLDIPMPDGGTATLDVEREDLQSRFYGETGSDPEMARQVERATGGAVKAGEWIKMTDAERREVVEGRHVVNGEKVNGLVQEGDFALIDPNDPTLYIVASDAERIVGRIKLDPSADPGAAFHEVMHGFLRFAQETGFWDETDVKWLQDTYGKPQNATEQLNEENAADGFRQYLARRLSGSITEEPSAWRKLFSLFGRLRHLRERNAAVDRIASNAEESLYDQLLAGKYAHIRDLKFTAPAAPKVETGGESAAPQTGAKPKETAAGNETKQGDAETKQGDAETKSAKTETEPGNSAPRVVRWEAQTPKGNKYVGGYYQIFKLSDLIHSNHPLYKAHEALQGRNRKDNKREEEQRGRIKAEFNGRRYLDNAVTSDGAPLVAMLPDEKGVVRPFVVSGNGRVLVLNELAESHLYDKYRDPLKEWAEKNGVENGVADADNPVLVRVVDDLKGSNLLQVSRLSNVETTTPPTETELARTDAEHLRSLDLAKLYHANADGSPDMTPGVNDEFFRMFSQGPSGETIFDEDRYVGEDAQRRVMRAFLHLAVGDSPRGLAAAQKLITMSGTYGIDRQKGALQAMAPDVARTEANPDYSIGPDVARAIADFLDFVEMKRAGKVGTFDEYAAQGDMYDQPSEIAADLTRTLAEASGTARDMSERVKAYADIARRSDADGALGGEGNARSREDVWREAGKLAEQRIAERKTSPQEQAQTPKNTGVEDSASKYGKVSERSVNNVIVKLVKYYDIDESTFFADGGVLGEVAGLPSKPVRTFVSKVRKLLADRMPSVDAKMLRTASWKIALHELQKREGEEGGKNARFSISGIYTGSAADYDKPSLHHVGTGEGSQVYGWGLYGSTVRGVAEGYADLSSQQYGNRIMLDRKEVRGGNAPSLALQHLGYITPGKDAKRQIVTTAEILEGNAAMSRDKVHNKFPSEEKAKEYDEAAKWIRDHVDRIEIFEGPKNTYEQTFFTDRAPGDESHLLKWYEPVSEEQRKWVLDALEKENLAGESNLKRIRAEEMTGRQLYELLSGMINIGDEKAASEFLARAGIDGVKYPVDSYGGKGVKNGDEVGWNYVSFRDDNIRVDHKWTDGQQRYSIAQTRTPQFKRWFGGSKAVDENGDPLVVYRRDNDAFTAFDQAKSQQNDAGWLGKGFYFYGDKGEAERATGYGKTLRSFYLKAENPYYITPEEYNRLVEADDPKVSAEFTQRLKDEGYDSVYWNGDLRQEWMVLDSNQIKSATENTGTFSPINSDIRYSIVSLGGRDVAVVDDLDAARSINPTMPADVEKYILDHLEDGIEMLAGGTASITEKTAKHFAWSAVRGKYGSNRRMRKARAQSAAVFRDLVQMFSADASTKQNDYHGKGDEIWKCRLPFGVPLFGNHSEQVVGGVVYDADIIIKDAGDGKFLYDVSNPEKNEALTQQLTAQAQSLFDGRKRAVETVSARAPDAPEGTADNIPNPADEIKRDPEAFARNSIVSRMEEGGEDEKESALVAFVAERALRHGPRPNAIKTIGRLGLEMGLKSVDTGRIIRKGEALAERVRGTVIEKAVLNGDVATATALLARESDIDRAVADGIDEIVAGASAAGRELSMFGERRIKNIIDRQVEKTVRSFNAASLSDVERDTGIDIEGEILDNHPDKFDHKPSKPAKGASGGEKGGGDGSGTGGGEGDGSAAPESDRDIEYRRRIRKEAEERVAKMIATAKERAEKAKKLREERDRLREERRRRAEEAAGRDAEREAELGEDGAATGAEAAIDKDLKLATFADFKTKEEFAAFFRVWAEEHYKKEVGTTTLGKHEENRLFPEYYRKSVVRELQDLADKLLPPKGARATVNRWLGEIEPGVKPDTLERVSADVFAFINKNAIRESSTTQVKKFRDGLKEFIKDPQFDDLKMDADRKVTGWVEEAAGYIRRICNLSIRSINGEPSQLEQERARLEKILDRREKVYDDEGKATADAPKFDMETRRALAKLELLEKYGAMKQYMPGQIADLADEAMRWLNDEAAKLEDNWREARETEDQIRDALTAGIVGPNGQRYQKGKGVGAWFDGLFDSMNGMIRLRLQHLVRFADSKTQQKAKDAINRVMVMLGDGEVAFARHLQDDRAAFYKGLAQIFATPDGKGVDRRALADWLNRMTEAIPKELSEQLSYQGYADSMTYGQMLQLLVSLEQRSYDEAIMANGREGQAKLIRTFETVGPDGRRERVLTDKDILFIDWLRSFYETKREMLSSVTRRMVGLPVDSPDPLYCPVKMYMGNMARGMHVDSSAAWDPIGAVFTRRIAHVIRDFDESATILGLFFDRSAESAKLAAWGERGSIIRGVFTDAGVQESIRRAFGGGELSKILKQLEETFNGGESIKKSPGEIAAADKAMNWMTYLALGYNPLSAAKQTTSFTVWANALPGGFKDLWRYMTDVDMATIRHIKESDEYRVRYGNDVGSGQDVATKSLNENPSENPLAAFFRKTSMGLLRKGDFLPGGWIAQGLFRDLYNRHLKEGMDAEAADRLAMTETFNMLEETQQSGRTYNTSALAREHGRLGRLLVQFATSPLQQLQYEGQAFREIRDLMRYRPPTPDADYEQRLSEAKGKLVRAAVINHVLLPAALHAVTNLYRLAMGYDPEWEKEGWHWSLLRDVVMGQFSRVFFLGAISTVTTDVLISGKPVRDMPALIPAEGVIKLLGNMAVTVRDVATLDYDRVQKDLDRLLKSTSITRTPYDIGRLVTGKAYAERKERREKREPQNRR